jgi:membrane peptidoglycan carboxypeptidase
MAGKTGTTNDAKDVWFIGYTSNIAAGCYIGYDQPRTLATAPRAAASAARCSRISWKTAIKKYGGAEFRVPPGGYFIKIDRFTGQPLPDDATSGDNVVAEYFRDGEEALFGLGVMVDGGFAMGENLPLFAYGEGEGGGDQGTTVTNSDRRDRRRSEEGRFRHRFVGRALLTIALPGGRALAGARPNPYDRPPETRTGPEPDARRNPRQHRSDRKSLKLLAQRMDWETAPHRLEEFDAMIEAPDLWNDPAKAQKLMRDRQALLDAVNGLQADRQRA